MSDKKTKKSKHPRYDDPTAFSQHWPTIRETDAFSSAYKLLRADEKYYTMGKVKITLVRPSDDVPMYFMTIRCNNRYPTWDEVVWIRYNLIPDAAVMTMVLPNLNSYINQEDNGFKFVFTFEQKGWALDPHPTCKTCDQSMVLEHIEKTTASFCCEACGREQVVEMTTWNEEHGNGFNGWASR